MPVCRHHFFKIQVYVLVDTDRRSSAFKRPSDIVLRWSDLTNPRADFFSFSSSSFFFFCRHGGGGVPAPPGSATGSITGVACRACHSSDTFFHCDTHASARKNTRPVLVAGRKSLGLVLIFWQNLTGHGDDV